VSNPSPADWSRPAPLLVVSRFRVPEHDRAAFLADAATALDVLAAQAGCLGASLGQSTDEAGLLVIRTEWEGVGAYRRALSSFDVKVHGVPLLSRAIDEPSAYELFRHWTPEGLRHSDTGLAADAGTIGLGSAAAPSVPSTTTPREA
jgi:quinol monooxygenase YgiN